jgi:hypothetical protein
MMLQSSLDHRHLIKGCSAGLLKGRKQGRWCDLGMVALLSIQCPASVLKGNPHEEPTLQWCLGLPQDFVVRKKHESQEEEKYADYAEYR